MDQHVEIATTLRPHSPPTTRRSQHLAVAVAMFALASIPFVGTATNLAFPAISRHFGDTSRSTLSWILTGTSIVVASFTLLGGQLTDRFGGFRVFNAALVVSVVTNAIGMFAPNPAVLIASRAAYGVSSAFVLPASLGVALAHTPEERRAFVIGLWTATFPIASVITPVSAALTINAFGWRGAFGVGAALSLLALGLATTLPRASADRGSTSDAPPDFLGIVIGTLCVGLLALAIVKGREWGWTSPTILGAGLGSMVLAPLFVRRSQRHPQPLVDIGLFRLPSYRIASAANLFISAIGSSTWLLWPLLMAGQWHYSQLRIGFALTPTPAIGAVLSLLVARRSQGRRHALVLMAGPVVTVVGLAWAALVLSASPNFVVGLLPVLLIVGIGMGLTFAPLNAAALADVPASQVGRANAAFATGRNISNAIGIATVVALLDSPSTDPITPFNRAHTALGVAAVAAFVVLLIGWRTASARTA